MAILLLCAAALSALSGFSKGIYTSSKVCLLGKPGLHDTAVTVNGKIIDSITNEPIPSVTLTFFRDTASIKTIVSDEKGAFSIDIINANYQVQLSAVGYQGHSFFLTTAHNNLLKLIPANNTLPDVVVSSRSKKKPNADWIIRKVNKQMSLNYGDLSFVQKFANYTVTSNYDTVKLKSTELFTARFYKGDKMVQCNRWLADTSGIDVSFFKLIQVPNFLLGDVIRRADIIRMGVVLGDKQSKNFDFRLLAHYQDKNYGYVYLVSFKPYQTDSYNDLILRGFIDAKLPLGYLNGVMLIREEDDAVVSLKYNLELQPERFNVAIQNFYHSSSWKTHIVGKIISDSRVYQCEYSYRKDSVSGKYFVQTIKASCNDKGYQIENHRSVQLNYRFDVTSLGVENIVE